jgi:hypothetical protein
MTQARDRLPFSARNTATAAVITPKTDGKILAGTFLTQTDGADKYHPFDKSVDKSIDGVLARSVKDAAANSDVNGFRIVKGQLFSDIAEINGVSLGDAVGGKQTIRTLLEKQGFEIVPCEEASYVETL